MMVILISGILAYAGMRLFSVETASGLTANSAAQPEDIQLKNSERIIPAREISCANPIPDREDDCQRMEQAIMDSSVRIMMYTTLMEIDGICCRSINANGYATVKDGRYLVTHNHYNEAVFSLLQQGDPEGQVYVNVINTNGEVILTVPAQAVAVHLVEGETSILDFGEVDGVGVLSTLGLKSAEYKAQPSLPIQPGMEVAQIDWDGSVPHINWTSIEDFITDSETPNVKVSSCIKKGASGGGLFWRGYHIGNNWSRSFDCKMETAPSGAQHSFAALNSAFVAAS
jgi:hypothetical protein